MKSTNLLRFDIIFQIKNWFSIKMGKGSAIKSIDWYSCVSKFTRCRYLIAINSTHNYYYSLNS